jgi:hypothetical protein
VPRRQSGAVSDTFTDAERSSPTAATRCGDVARDEGASVQPINIVVVPVKH